MKQFKGIKRFQKSENVADSSVFPSFLTDVSHFPFICPDSFPFHRVAHFIPDIMPVISSDQYRIRQMVSNTRLLLGVLAKVHQVLQQLSIWFNVQQRFLSYQMTAGKESVVNEI